MSKQELYRGPADENPIDLSKVPTEPLGHRFPILTKPLFKPSCKRFAWQLYLVALGFAGTTIMPLNPGWTLLICFFGFLVVLRLLTHEFNNVKPVFSIPVFAAALLVYGCLFAALRGHSLGPLVLFGVATYLSLSMAYLFAEHWKGRACCGMLDEKATQAFLKSNRLPDGVSPRPFLPSFVEALESWIGYDPKRCKSPGTQPSPAGGAGTRLSLSTSLVVLWSGLLAIVCHQLGLTILLPLLVVFAVLLPIVFMAVLAAPVLGTASALIDVQFDPSLWRGFTRSLTNSQNAFVKQSLYLGRSVGDGAPIHYPTDRLMLGGWVQGPPGSGKTNFLMQMLEQLIWQGYSVVTMDLKATSNELYWTAREAANEVYRVNGRRVPVYPFTPTNGRPTHLFDLFSQPFWNTLSPEQKASCMIGIFGLNYPCVYPQDWFRDAAWAVEQHVTSKYPNLTSFHDAAVRSAEELQLAMEPWELSRSVKEHGEHPRLILQRLGLADAMNARPTFSQEVLGGAINLESLFHTPSVLHCSLPAVSDPVTNPEIGRVLLNALLHAGAHTSKPSVKVVVLLDETQRLISRSIDVVLQQARSSGVGVLLTNQTSADLAAVDPNMPGTLSGVTSLQAWIKATDALGVQQVQTFGGQYIDYLNTTSISSNANGKQTTYTQSEQLLDRCSSGLIDRVNSTPNQYFLRLSDADGYAAYGGQMMVVQSGYHTTQQEYEALVRRPWPDATPQMLVNGQHRPANTPPPSALTGRRRTKGKHTPTQLS